MDRAGPPDAECRAAVCLAGPGAIELVLSAPPTVGDDAGVAGPAGRTVHAAAVLRDPSDDGLAAAGGLPGQSEARAAPAAAVGAGDDLPEAAHQHAGAGPSALPLPVAGPADHPRRSGVVERHHLHSAPAGLGVPGRDPGLVQPLRRGLGALEYPGR